MAATKSVFGTYEGQPVFKVDLTNGQGTTAEIITYGGSWHAFKIQDKKGMERDVIVSPSILDGYLNQFNSTPYFFGGLIGRHAGRIDCKKDSSKLKGYRLNEKDGVHLHGGKYGFARKIWDIKEINDGENPSVTLSYRSKPMEEGYPGELTVEVRYELTEENEMNLSYHALSDNDTVVNLTNHAYFNLGGNPITSHQLYLASDQRLKVEADLIPTGDFQSTEGTPYDFKDYCPLSKIRSIGGLDDTYIFNNAHGVPQVMYRSAASGIEMKIYTDQPSVVVFAPRRLAFIDVPKNEKLDYDNFPAICFETQNPPDSANQPHFPQSFLKKGCSYIQNTKFSFVTYT